MKNLKPLEKEFKEKINILLQKCNSAGYIFVPYSTIRTPIQQAKLWRQSRSTSEIRGTVSMLLEEKANYLAKTLWSVGPQYGRWATNSLPGLSWHQHKEAIDCYLYFNNQAIWDDNHPGYKYCAEAALDLGLSPGYFWKNKDAGHIQKRDKKVTDVFSWIDLDENMKLQFDRSE